MTIDKAIELLKFHHEWLEPLKDPDLTAATKLGVEALKCVKEFQRKGTKLYPLTLKGETKE